MTARLGCAAPGQRPPMLNRRNPEALGFPGSRGPSGTLAPRVPGVLATESGSIELSPAMILADVPRLRAALEAPRKNGGLLLIGRRHVRSNNSWMHNVRALVKGRDRCTLLVNPEDAKRLDRASKC